MEVAEIVARAGGDVEKVRLLMTDRALRIGVVEDPFARFPDREIGVVAVYGHHILTDEFDFVRRVFEKIEAVLLSFRPGPGADVFRIAPDEMGGEAGGIEDVEIFPIEIGGEHAGGKAAVGLKSGSPGPNSRQRWRKMKRLESGLMSRWLNHCERFSKRAPA